MQFYYHLKLQFVTRVAKLISTLNHSWIGIVQVKQFCEFAMFVCLVGLYQFYQ